MAGPTLRLNLNTVGVKQGARDVDAAFNKIKKGAATTEQAVNKSGSAISRLGKMSGQQRFIFNNTANQLGDIAVQASMGTNIFRVLGMQLPQIAGGFALLGGPIGVVASVIGVVAAVAFPLIAVFSSLGKEAKTLAEEFDELEDTADSAADALGRFDTPVVELTENFGQFSASIKEGRGQIARMRLGEFARDLIETGKQLSELRKNDGIFERLRFGSEKFGSAVRKLSKEFAVTQDEVKPVVDALEELDNVTTTEEATIAFGKLRSALVALNPTTDEAKSKVLEYAEAALRGEESGGRFVRMMDLMGGASRRANTELGAVTEGLALLTSQIDEAQVALDVFGGAGRDINRTSFSPLDAFGGAGSFEYDVPTTYTEGTRLFEENQRKQEQAARKAAQALKQQQNEYRRLVRDLKPALTIAQEYEKAVTDIQQAVKIKAITEQEGAIATAEATRRYQIASGELADYTDVANTFANSLEDSLVSLVDGTSSVKDAFRSLATSVIKELLRVLVVQRLVNAAMGVFGFAPAAGGGYIPIGDVGNYGGPVQPNKGIVVGESGPEVFYPQTQGTIVPNSATGGNITVNQTINVSTGVQQTVRTEIKSLMPQIAESAKAAVADAKRRGGSYGKAFA